MTPLKIRYNALLLPIAAFLLLFISEEAEAFVTEAIVGLATLAGTAISNMANNATNRAAQAVTDLVTGGPLKTVKSMLENADIGTFVGELCISFLRWLSGLLDAANTIIFRYVFGDLLILIDYEKVPGAGRHVNQLYNTVKIIGFALAGFFFIISSGVTVFRMAARRSWKDVVRSVGMLLAALLLIQTFPYIFSISQTFVGAVTGKIMEVNIKGEDISHAPGGKLRSGVSDMGAPLAGLEMIERDIDYILDLPENLIEEGRKIVYEAKDKAITYVETEAGKLFKEEVKKPVDDAIAGGIESVRDAITGKKGSKLKVGSVKDQEISKTRTLKAAVYILKGIISIMQLGMILLLFSIKGFQLVALLVLFILAPLALSFMVLPIRDNIGLKFLKTIWAIMAWNIVWAIGIKVYFITGLIIDSVNDASATSQLTAGMAGVIPFAGIFMKMGVMMVMVSVSTWVGIIAAIAISSAVGIMSRQLTGLPRLAQSVGKGTVTAAAFVANPKVALASVFKKAMAGGGSSNKGDTAMGGANLNGQRNAAEESFANKSQRTSSSMGKVFSGMKHKKSG